MGFVKLGHDDGAYKNPGRGSCRFCKGFIKTLGKRCFIASLTGNLTRRDYCSDTCYWDHKKEIREGAAARVAAYLKKKETK